MKLYFSKNEHREIIVKMSTGTEVEEFDYVKMIKNLLMFNIFEESDFSEEITEEEKTRIGAMLYSINDSIVLYGCEDEEDEGL